MLQVGSFRVLCQVRHALKLRGYKKGRISQLVSLTRPTSTASGAGAAAGPNPASGQSVGEVGDASEVVAESQEQVLQVLQEVAEEERLNEEVRGCPEILQDNEDAELEDLPRLYGKQSPRGASHVVAPDWVKEILALFPEPGAEEKEVAEEPEAGHGRKNARKTRRTMSVHPASQCLGGSSSPDQRRGSLQVL